MSGKGRDSRRQVRGAAVPLPRAAAVQRSAPSYSAYSCLLLCFALLTGRSAACTLLFVSCVVPGSARIGSARPARCTDYPGLMAARVISGAHMRRVARELCTIGLLVQPNAASALCRVQPRRSIIDLSYSTHFMDFKGSSIASSMNKLVVNKLSPNFREAVSLRTVAVPTPGDADLLVRNR